MQEYVRPVVGHKKPFPSSQLYILAESNTHLSVIPLRSLLSTSPNLVVEKNKMHPESTRKPTAVIKKVLSTCISLNELPTKLSPKDFFLNYLESTNQDIVYLRRLWAVPAGIPSLMGVARALSKDMRRTPEAKEAWAAFIRNEVTDWPTIPCAKSPKMIFLILISPQHSGIGPPAIQDATKGKLSRWFLSQCKYCFKLVLLFPTKMPPGTALDSAIHAIFLRPDEINA
jgi:hypothetical protein